VSTKTSVGWRLASDSVFPWIITFEMEGHRVMLPSADSVTPKCRPVGVWAEVCSGVRAVSGCCATQASD
jgi:hypothetical protein